MRISPISVNQNYHSKNVRHSNPQKQNPVQPSFNGLKGAGIGAGAGLLWGGAIVAMCAVAAPYMLPVIGVDALIGGAGAGALAGHCIEKDLKDDK